MTVPKSCQPCPKCHGKGFVECWVVYEAQRGDEVPYDAAIRRHYGDPEDESDLKKYQHVGWGVWDCDGTDEEPCTAGGE